MSHPHACARASLMAGLLLALSAPLAGADTVVPDNQSVQGNLCVGIDCANPENYGLSTLKLKENNTRVRFEDTSAAAGYASTDWELIANENDSGGRNLFRLADLDAGTTPFTVLGAAPSKAFWLANTGNVGLGTDNPLLHLHLEDGNTPGIRLAQTNAGGFTPQTWDVAGNEANFFVRDLTGGSRLPFRIRPGAPTSSIDIAATGRVGMGTASPEQALHVKRTDGTAQALIEETSGTVTPRLLADLSNKGPAEMRFKNTDAGAVAWRMGNDGTTGFAVKPEGGAAALTLTPAGDATTAGALRQNADPAATENAAGIDARDVLARVATLPMSSYEYKDDPTNARHLGPSGADFRSAFGLGASNGDIAPSDMGAVSLIAIKALDARIDGIQRGAEGAKGEPGERGPAGPAGPAGMDAKAMKRITALEKTNKKQAKQLKSLTRKLRALAKKR